MARGWRARPDVQAFSGPARVPLTGEGCSRFELCEPRLRVAPLEVGHRADDGSSP
jgi:hypothetical protein